MPDTHAKTITAHDFSFQTIEGDDLPLSSFKGKAVLIVNTASHCGFTPQYKGLQAVWEKYRDEGLVVLGVPSNDFGKQEPGQADEIKEFCEVNYGVDFPLSDKTVVKGKEAHPFYKWAREELGFIAAPKWNFHKYLINGDGKLVDWFATTTPPSSSIVTNKLEKLLRAQ
ncbi:glutathione peroxidase [Terasakiella sp. A23]|uniref:glutathione peroxidase n=1 Tax=Terasakiella sp. FCG-A23 TaxID=3080561 RepID=UPI00295404DF|nr:glutathione peroxidase [Terasakiella sp. A23]MDV7340262.1 glutathione peroxidase [Terasakiella sp. A23]